MQQPWTGKLEHGKQKLRGKKWNKLQGAVRLLQCRYGRSQSVFFFKKHISYSYSLVLLPMGLTPVCLVVST